MIDVSVIIVSYNTEKLTKECIESVIKEDSKYRFEIIVVDNNSKDGSVAMIEIYCKKYSNITLITNSENKGFSKANNQGINVAKGRHILLLNSDTVVKKYAIGKLIEFADTTVDAGVVAPKLLNSDGSTQASVFNFPSLGNAIREYYFLHKNVYGKKEILSSNPVEVDAVVGAAFLITNKALKKIGGLNEKYFFYYEDIDYCRSVWRKGLKVYYFPKSEITHYHGISGKNLADHKNQWRRLIPSSKIYHGLLMHYLINFVLWSGQKINKLNK